MTLRCVTGGFALGSTPAGLLLAAMEVTCHGDSSLLERLTALGGGWGAVFSECVRWTVTTWEDALVGTLFTLVDDTLRVTALLPENDVSCARQGRSKAFYQKVSN